MRNVSMIIWAMVVVLVAGGTSRADLIGYVACYYDSDLVYFTNFGTGEQTALGHSGMYSAVRALEISPIDGRLFAIGSDDLWTIDTTTGAGSKIGSVGTNLIHNLAFAPNGTLYGIAAASELGVNESKLMTIDTGTGATTVIGSTLPYERIMAFAIDEGGRGIGLGWNAGGASLFQIDLTDGSTDSIGQFPSPFGFSSFDYGPDGILYGWSASGMGGEYYDYFYRIDVENLQRTHLRTFRNGLSEFAIIPEPATLLLLGLGALVLRRSRRA